MPPCYLARVRALIRSSLQGRRRKYWPEHGGSRIPKTFRLYPAESGYEFAVDIRERAVVV
jgi:hypothetical protein